MVPLILEIRQKNDAEMHGVDPISIGDRHDERDDDDQCRENVHQTAHHQEEEVQYNQKDKRALGKCFD